jgi:hypothetical protein
VLDKVDDAVAGCFGADETSAPVLSFTCQNADVLVLQFLVSSEEEPNLPSARSNITSWKTRVRGSVVLNETTPTRDIRILTDVAGELSHERRAEAPDLAIRLALRVKVRASLPTTHGQSSQGILESLLEPEEFEDRQIDARVETETTLVRTKG